MTDTYHDRYPGLFHDRYPPKGLLHADVTEAVDYIAPHSTM